MSCSSTKDTPTKEKENGADGMKKRGFSAFLFLQFTDACTQQKFQIY